MKIEVKFNNYQDPHVVLTPENRGERMLLGAVLHDSIVGRVVVKPIGHSSSELAEMASIILSEEKPNPRTHPLLPTLITVEDTLQDQGFVDGWNECLKHVIDLNAKDRK